MAAILQLRRGAITDFNGYGTNLSEPYFDTDRDTIHIGTSDGTGSNADWITLVKLSQANRDFTKSEPNTGSLWIVGDITASDNPNVNLGPYDAISNPNGYDPYSGVLPSSIHSTSSMYLNGNLTASHAWFRRDVRIDGHLILGDSNNPSTVDVVNVQADFSGSLIPDNDAYSTQTSTPLLAYHDLGTNSKRWRNLYLGLGANDFISASNADFSGSVKIDGTLETDGQATLASANIEDLTNNRIVIAGIDGELEDDENFIFDGDEFNIGLDNFTVQRDSGNTHTSGTLDVDGQATLASANVEDLTETRLVIVGSNGELQDSPNLTFDDPNFRLIGDYYQSGSGATFQFVGAGGEITGSWTISELAVDNGIVFTNEFGTLDNSPLFTWDGGLLKVDGNISGSGTLEIDGQSTLASLNVEDLTNDRILIAGTDGEVEDDQYFRYTGNNFIIGSAEHFKVTTASGNTFISGAVQMFSTLNVDDQSTLASLNVEDLIDNRVVIVGAGGEIEDDGNFTFNGTELNIGTGNFTVQQGSGDVHTVGNVDIDLDLNIDGGDLTTNQTTFNLLNSNATTVNAFGASTSVNIGTGGQGGGLTTIGHDLTVIGDLTIQGETTQLNTTTLNVEDINILIASGATDSNAANGAGITIDGADVTMNWDSLSGRLDFNDNVEVEGNLYVDTIYRTSTDNTYIDLDASAINFGIGGGNELQIDGTQTRIYGNLQLDGDLISNGNISGSSFNGTTLLSSSNENFGDYSQSVDSRLVEIFTTGSDHEQRIDSIESISGSLLYSASNDFSEITLNRIDGTTLEIDATPRKVIESVINKNGFMEKGTPVYVSGSTGNALHIFAASASRSDRMPATFILDQDLNSEEEGYGILGGFINGVNTSLFEEGDNVYVGADGGYTNSRPTGSNIQVQKLGNVIKKAVNGSGVITGAGRSNDLPNIQEGYLWVGDGDGVATTYDFTTFSSSVDLRLLESFTSASDHETRVINLESTASDHELRLLESFETASDHELRLLESFTSASDHELRLLESFTSASDHETRIQEIEDTNLQSFVSSSIYTILDTDNKSTIFFSSSNDITITIDTLTTPNFECNFYNLGSTTASFQDGTATVGYPDGTELLQDKVAALTRVMATNIYKLKGELN